MRKPTWNLRRTLPLLGAALLVVLSACGPSTPSPTPTMSVDAIYTAAFQTFSAQQATQLALTPPTATASRTPPPSLAPPTSASTSPVPGTGGTLPAGGTPTCDSSVYVSDITVPDGTVMTPGQTFVKTWALRNNGTCPWTTSYKLAFVGGDAMGGTSAPLAAAVPPGQQANVSITLTAPATAGDYTGSWELQNASGAFFGNIITVVIKVSGAGGAGSTPEATSTP